MYSTRSSSGGVQTFPFVANIPATHTAEITAAIPITAIAIHRSLLLVSAFSFLHIDLHSFCFADMVNNESSGIHACMKCHLTSISIETIVEMVIFYFQCTSPFSNITFVRFESKKIFLNSILCFISRLLFYYMFQIKKIRIGICCICVNITPVRFKSQVIFI